jgi:hypothetical protein
MIEIKYLTRKQVRILDNLWACDTQVQIDAFLCTLLPSDRKLAESLLHLIILEGIDEFLLNDLSDAHEVLWRVMYG